MVSHSVRCSPLYLDSGLSTRPRKMMYDMHCFPSVVHTPYGRDAAYSVQNSTSGVELVRWIPTLSREPSRPRQNGGRNVLFAGPFQTLLTVFEAIGLKLRTAVSKPLGICILQNRQGCTNSLVVTERLLSWSWTGSTGTFHLGNL